MAIFAVGIAAWYHRWSYRSSAPPGTLVLPLEMRQPFLLFTGQIRVRRSGHSQRPASEAHLRFAGLEEDNPTLIAIYQPKPDLSPLGAYGLKLPAVTVLEAVIDERGNVVDLRIVKPVDSKAAELIAAGIRSWRFKPATLHGKPVKVHYTLTVNIHYE